MLTTTLILVIWMTRSPRNVTLAATLTELGFSHVYPPTTLLQPGTVAHVRNQDPFWLGVVCRQTTALALTGKADMCSSTSIDINIKTTFDTAASFGFPDAFLSSAEVQSVLLTLTNVQIIELPDDAIPATGASELCRGAIESRLAGDAKLTVIKAALVADATYQIRYSQAVTLEQQQAVTQAIAATSDLSIRKTGATTLEGTQLIWGVVDDPSLLRRLYFTLPSTGGETRRHLLPERFYRVASEELPVTVLPSLNIIRQPSNMSCWAAAFTMMYDWRERQQGRAGTGSANPEICIRNVIAKLGPRWLAILDANSGLSDRDQKDFVQVSGLTCLAPQNFTPAGWHSLLANGPLWVTTGNGFAAHARLLVGMTSPGPESLLTIVDPADGNTHIVSWPRWLAEFEREARFMVDNGLAAQHELRMQVMHW